MSKKARRRPSWGKYRQKYGKWAVYYQKTKSVYGDIKLSDFFPEIEKRIRRPDEKILERLLNDYIFKNPL